MSLYPPFQNKVDQFLQAAKSQGLNVGVHQALRTWQQQDALYAQGRTKPGKRVTKARGGESWHNYGLAVDVVFKNEKGWSWDDSHPWNKLGEIGEEIGLKWGASFGDRPHFEWKDKMSISLAKIFYKKGGLAEVWLNLPSAEKK